MNNYELIDKAITYATKHHEGVSRKGKKIPYILHPLEAMSVVATITDDNELIAAAALHDLIEDTDVTYDDIKLEFGKRIADIVNEESDNTLPNYGNLGWKEKKALALNRLKNANLDVKIVALGDKLSNIRAIHNDYYLIGNDFWNRFRESNPSSHKWRYMELVKCFDELKDTNAYKEFEWLVKDTFKGIE